MLHKVTIAGLAMDSASNTPIVILKSEENEQIVPIWIGLLEATSIASALKKIQFDRPMTHDLFKNFADLLEIEIVRIEVSDIKDNTYYARIYFQDRERQFSMDARPSDAIALALRSAAPIFVDEQVIRKSQPLKNGSEVMDESEEGRKWADYLENLDPEDFGKYKV